jgi:hypothetical protein
MERAKGGKQIREHVILDAKKFRRTADGAFLSFFTLSPFSLPAHLSYLASIRGDVILARMRRK